MKLDRSRRWNVEGHFRDRNGTLVKAKDDVLLHRDATCVSPGTVDADLIPQGAIGTVIFLTEDEPVWLSLECTVGDGFAFAENYPAGEVSLHKTTEQKWPKNAPNR
jgi:hypothetical protein